MERARRKIDGAMMRGCKRTLQWARRSVSGAPEHRCLLVAGVQRSGTNMVMDVLERSYVTDVYHERDPRAFDNYHMHAPELIRSLIGASNAPVVAIKCLLECQRLVALLEAFQPARAVWVVRDYRDVVNSMLVSFRNQARQVVRIAGDRNSDGWLGEGMSDQTHELIRRLATADLDDATAAALQWYFRNIRFFEQGLDASDQVMLMCYELMVTRPHEQFERLFRFVGLRYTPGVSRQVYARSVGRRPPPQIAPEVAALCDGLMQRFAACRGPHSGSGD